jgi:hypothetical protein
MKTLVDKIIEAIQESADEQYNEFAKKQLIFIIDKIKEIEENAEFEEVALLLIKHINKYHPHHTIIVDATHAELLEGEKTTGIVLNYVRD